MMRSLLCGTVIIELIAWLSASANSQTVDFQRDIQPLLAEKCLHCHGTDAATRQGGLRLDDAAAAERGGDSGPAFVVGNSKASRLIERIHSTDADVVMPPPKEGKPLTDREKKLLADWIDQGAVYSKHWAFEAPKKLPLPGSQPDGNDAAAVHPIDAWVRHGLATQKLKPNPPAPDYAVCRRLYLDLTGLPPSPEQVEAYRRDGHTATVEALLSSPRYGEKWARHWLDVARYSDTNGYEKDLQRDQWIWRDWVVNAFNDDMPYDQFIVRQIAGDLLPDATQNDLIATGFLRNSMLNEEGAIVPEQFRMVEMFDRMDCIGKGILGLSTQCAQCHTHKFDPITQSEYYGMFAFLNNAYEAQSWIYDAGQQQTLQQAHAEIDRLIATAKSKLPDAEGGLAQWLADVQSKQGNWRPVKFDDLGSISGLNHPVQLDDHSVLMLGHTSADVFMSGVVPAMNATGLRLELLTHGDLPFRGPGRSRTGTWQIHELELFVKTPGSDQWQKQKLVAATADFSESEVADKEGKKRTGPVAFLVDGSDDTTWQADRGGGLRNHPSVAVMQLEKPLALVEGSQIKIAMRMGNMPGCVRFSLTEDAEPRAPVVLWEALQEQLEPNQAAQAQRRTNPNLKNANSANACWRLIGLRPRNRSRKMPRHCWQPGPRFRRGTHLSCIWPNAPETRYVSRVIWIVAIGINRKSQSLRIRQRLFIRSATRSRRIAWRLRSGSSIVVRRWRRAWRSIACGKRSLAKASWKRQKTLARGPANRNTANCWIGWQWISWSRTGAINNCCAASSAALPTNNRR